ncbi:FAD-dependent oxidoreductase [Cellulosilyticum sp. I15G10I2]|uniref:FAD-dependent oxidoreductase n=1 Tax=Cellulosilyticum sp. I15G10I2 TaxID=1892843 RepID=UPI00085CC861|nr:FAD-dependent oxidoreductase [Cellulosilyticum sp. I15G10I2]
MKKFLIICILGCFSILNYFTIHGLTSDKIIIIGSEPECITAAVTASKLGYDVTLITESSRLGGLFIEGMLTALDINFNENNKVLHSGFFEDFLKACSNGYNIDFKLTEAFFYQVIKDYHINVIYNAKNLAPIVSQDQLVGVNYTLGNTVQKLYGTFIVDGSSEASFSRKLGIPYKKGRSEFGEPHTSAAATLIFSVKNADWNQIISYLDNDDDIRTGFKRNAAWGFNIMYQCPTSHDRLQMRGLNLSRQNDNSIVVNALLIFDVDPSHKKDVDEAYLLAKKELPEIIKYLSKHCPGFEKASLDKIADKLYIREGVRIVGEDTLSSNDVFEHTDFPNTIAYGSYPMDLQASKKGEYGNALCGKCLYSLPLGCMIPKGIQNLLVIGRSASFDIMAHGSARTIPVLMSMAENGIVAIDYSLRNHISMSKLNKSYKDLALFYKYIYNFNGFKRLELPKSTLNESWYYPYIHDLRSKGFFSLGYTFYDLDSRQHTKKTINNTLTLLGSYSSYTISNECKAFIHNLNDNIKTQDLCKLASYLLNDNFNSLEDLRDKKIIDEIIYTHIANAQFLSHGEIFAILDVIIKKVNPYIPLIIYKDTVEIIRD